MASVWGFSTADPDWRPRRVGAKSAECELVVRVELDAQKIRALKETDPLFNEELRRLGMTIWGAFHLHEVDGPEAVEVVIR